MIPSVVILTSGKSKELSCLRNIPNCISTLVSEMVQMSFIGVSCFEDRPVSTRLADASGLRIIEDAIFAD